MPAEKTLILINATVIDGTGSAAKHDMAVVISKGRIKEVCKMAALESEPETPAIDLQKRYVMPGLIDSHVHLGLDGGAKGTFSGDSFSTLLHMLKHAQISLSMGFTTLRDVGGRNGAEFALRKAIEDGLWQGPRLALAGKLLSITSAGSAYFEGMYHEADGVEEVRKATREQLKAGADLIKMIGTGAVMAPGEVPDASQYTLAEMQVAVQEASNAGKHVAVHAHGLEGIRNAVAAGARTVEHGTFLHKDDRLIDEMARKDIILVPTLKVFRDFAINEHADIPAFMRDKALRLRETHIRSITKAISGGVRIAMGTDAATPFNHHGTNAEELQLMQECGMSSMQTIVASTANGARAIGWHDWLGTIEAGKAADILVVNNNPLDDLGMLADPANIHIVVKDGLITSSTHATLPALPTSVISRNWLCCGLPYTP